MPNPLTLRQFARREAGGPLPWLPWIASALFVVGLIGVVATLVAVAGERDDEMLSIRVLDEATSDALSGAEVTIDGTPYVTDAAGRVAVAAPEAAFDIVVSHDGYLGRSGSKDIAGSSTSWVVSLRPEVDEQLALDTTFTDTLAAVPTTEAAPPSSPDAATDSTDQQDFPPANLIASPTPVLVAADTSQVSGTVAGADGIPIQGALITDGAMTEVTGADGVFTLQASQFASESLRVAAPGYADTTLSLTAGTAPLTVTMQLQPIKAIYYNPNISNTPEDLDRLIDLINTTEVNAMVIDVKEEIIFYDSQVQFFRDVGTVNPILDLPALLARLQENNIYTIARHVVFKDGLVAEARPDLAVTNNGTGEVWRDMNGVAWVNPVLHELWDANIALSVELAGLGFDEIQYDYVRFPTDGDISTMEFGLPYTEETRVAAIRGFLERSKQALLSTGAKQSADVFGFTTLVPDDLGIGQDITELSPHVDYLSPMVYPSHYPTGAMGLNGHPNDFPYETIEISLASARDQLGSALQLRPWLQDFDFPNMTPYDVAEVRAQIDAAEAVGASGWMLWDPNNVYTVGALGPDDGNMSRFEAPQAVMPVRLVSSTVARGSRA